MQPNKQIKYKQTALGLLPEDWEVMTVGSAFKICNNLRFPINEEERKLIQGIYPYYGPTKIQDYINEYRVEGKYALIGEDGDHFLKWQISSMTLLVEGKFNVNNHAHIILGESNLTEWFYYYFSQRELTPYLTRQGAGRYKLTKDALSKIPIPIPPLKTQQRIAKILTTADARIDKCKQIIEKLEIRNKGLLKELLSSEKRKDKSEKWKMVKLGDVATMSSGGTPLTSIKKYYNGSIPWVVIADITKADKYISDTEKKITEDAVKNSSAKVFPINTILFAMYASIGKCCIAGIELSCNQAILGITPHSIDTIFLYYFLKMNEEKYLTMGQTGTQNNLNKEMVSNFEFLIPSLQTQQKIATILDKAFEETKHHQTLLQQYQQQKKGLMQQLLTGKVNV